MVKKRFEDDEDEEEVEGGIEYREIDPNEKVDCISILKLGLPIMLNEVRRLKDLSQEKGLSGRGAGQITKYLETASSILKSHRNLNLNAITDEDLEKMDPMKLADLALRAAQQLGMDGSDLNVVKKGRRVKEGNNEN